MTSRIFGTCEGRKRYPDADKIGLFGGGGHRFVQGIILF
jgi:hypothetical protein